MRVILGRKPPRWRARAPSWFDVCCAATTAADLVGIDRMSFLARFRVLTKILAVIVLLAAISVGIAWLGISSLGSLKAGADDMSSASKRALMAADANQNVLALSRAEFRAALDPRPENRVQARKIVEEQTKNFETRMDEVSKT